MLGGLGGLIISFLVTWGFPEDAGGLHIIIEDYGQIYRYDMDTGINSRLLQPWAVEDIGGFVSYSINISPDGQWAATTFGYFDAPDKAYVIDLLAGTVTQYIEFHLHDEMDYFGTWSPDSRHVGWIATDQFRYQHFVLVLDPVTGEMRKHLLRSGRYTAGRWQNAHMVEVWSDTQREIYAIDITTGQIYVSSFTGQGCYTFPDECSSLNNPIELSLTSIEENSHVIAARLSPDEKQIAYIQLAGSEPHVFVYDIGTDTSRQVTETPLRLRNECLNENALCSIFGPWSPDKEWLVLRIDDSVQIINLRSGQVKTIFNEIVYSIFWTDISLPYNREHFPLWLVASAGFLMLGMWRAVR
ncbi:MAG: hypothetical protein L0154_12695 [Chloroflexi bacterium]|nr:hypothetical protein [Chloroflexota bacterium]